MTQPLNAPDFSGQTKIMFATEGNPTALLCTNKGGKRKMDAKPMSAEAAFVWCRKNAVMFVYCPADPSQN